jgi:anthranilate phosphoribosyltransferase
VRRRERQQQLGANALRFRELLAKVASGERTSTGLNRAEADEILTRLLQGLATPAQAGAFLIAHRLRRPQACELAGMADAYQRLGPTLPPNLRTTVSFGVPFDGRSRTAPVLPLTALVLNTAGLAVVLHGADPMPVKYGITQAELLEAMGLPLAQLDWKAMGRLFAEQGLALMHQPSHFPLAEGLIELREQIGKRPPIATLELLWSCCSGNHLQVSGFVHAPTELLMAETWALLGQDNGLTIKGLEGGVDLPTSRVSIAAHWQHSNAGDAFDPNPQRLILHARDHGLRADEPELTTLEAWSAMARDALDGTGPLVKPLIWNAGFVLWRCQQHPNLEAALETAERLLCSGSVQERRQELAAKLAGGIAKPSGSAGSTHHPQPEEA